MPLPKHVSDLMDTFARVYDTKNPTPNEFQKAQNIGASEHQRTGMGFGYGQGTAYISRELKDYLEERANYIWGKMQDAINATSIDFYPELNEDLKLKFSEYHTPVLNQAFLFIEKFQITSKENPAVFNHNKKLFYGILLHINADIDLFTVKYSTTKANEIKAGTKITHIVGNNNVVGDNNSQAVATSIPLPQSSDKTAESTLSWTQIIGVLTFLLFVIAIATFGYVIYDHFPKSSDGIITAKNTNALPNVDVPTTQTTINSNFNTPQSGIPVQSIPAENSAPAAPLPPESKSGIDNSGSESKIIQQVADPLNLTNGNNFITKFTIRVINPGYAMKVLSSYPSNAIVAPIKNEEGDGGVEVGSKRVSAYQDYIITFTTSRKVAESEFVFYIKNE